MRTRKKKKIKTNLSRYHSIVSIPIIQIPFAVNTGKLQTMKRSLRPQPPFSSSPSLRRISMAGPEDGTQWTSHFALRSFLTAFLCLVLVFLPCHLLFSTVSPVWFVSRPFAGGLLQKLHLSAQYNGVPLERFDPDNEKMRIKRVLEKAAMKDRTVILTTLNEAWAAPGSVFDLFLESFHIGENIDGLLNHLVVIALDQKAYARCLSTHINCLALVTEGVDFSGGEKFFMTPDYLEMMWMRIDFLRSVLEMGYSFVFTDADILWFRDPFPHFYLNADFQIACDHFYGNSFDIQNRPNGGFTFVKSNNRTIEFYDFWYSSRELYPGHHDQDVLNYIKHHPLIQRMGLRIRFLSTAYFGGLCEPSKDFNSVCTMHVNCCVGLHSKVHDMRIMLEDWKRFMSLSPREKRLRLPSWRVPQNCRLSAVNKKN